MEQVFADTTKAIIDYFMSSGMMEQYINIGLIIELCAQAVYTVLDGRGERATLYQSDEDG